jgi:hypothetical protein
MQAGRQAQSTCAYVDAVDLAWIVDTWIFVDRQRIFVDHDLYIVDVHRFRFQP